MTPEQMAEIQRLRSRKVAPKQIARKLGLRPAEVKAAIQQQAEAQMRSMLDESGLPPIESCWANGAMVEALFGNRDQDESGVTLGIGSVMVVRNLRNKRTAAIFLVDYYCLGIKNADCPEFSNDEKYRWIKSTIFEKFVEGPVEISLTQAQAIVFGAEDYARKLGFEPHRDYAEARTLLGERSSALPDLEFGRDGKPFYFDGPYDNPQKVIKTLEQSVGADNFDYMLQVLPPSEGSGLLGCGFEG